MGIGRRRKGRKEGREEVVSLSTFWASSRPTTPYARAAYIQRGSTGWGQEYRNVVPKGAFSVPIQLDRPVIVL